MCDTERAFIAGQRERGGWGVSGSVTLGTRELTDSSAKRATSFFNTEVRRLAFHNFLVALFIFFFLFWIGVETIFYVCYCICWDISYYYNYNYYDIIMMIIIIIGCVVANGWIQCYWHSHAGILSRSTVYEYYLLLEWFYAPCGVFIIDYKLHSLFN